MKRFAVVFFVALISILVLSSCDRKNCPAYSKAGTVRSERVG